MNEALLTAIQDRKPWLERFTRWEYARAFQEYEARFSVLFRTAIRETKGDYAALSEAILDALAQGWLRERVWNRTSRRFDEKQMVLLYLSPMLLDIGEEAFANCLREGWCRRWPKDTYEITSWQKLKRSFRTTIMGFEIGPRQDGDDE